MLLRRIDAAPIHRGNDVTVFFEGPPAFAAMGAAARRTFWLTNAYFAPRKGALPLLARAAARGVDVRLLLPGTSDVPLVRHAGHGVFRYLLERGVRIFEYDGSILHAKTVVVDGYSSMIGSTNMDFRSFHFNAECNIVALDTQVASTLERQYAVDLAQAREITLIDWNRRTSFHKLGDACARALSPAL